MGWANPIGSFLSGMRTYWAGVRWLKAHPRYLFYLMLPMVFGVICFAGALTLFATYDESLLQFLSLSRTETDPWWWDLIYYGTKIILYISVFVLTVILSFLMMNIVASPVYEVVSWAVEKEVTGREPEEISWKGLYRVMVSEVKKAFFIVGISLVILLIPGFNIFSTAVAAFLLAWDFYDYPLVRRGWSFKERLRLVSREFWSVLGLGVWMMVPLAQIVTVPLAVAGATMMNLEALKKYKQLNEGAHEHVERSRK